MKEHEFQQPNFIQARREILFGTGSLLILCCTSTKVLADVTAIDSIEQLRGLPPPSSGASVTVSGYYPGTDVGGGEFRFDPLSSDSDNSGTTFKPEKLSNLEKGRWKRVTPDYTPQQFGARADGTTNDRDAINAALKEWPTVEFTGNYLIGSNIPVPGNRTLHQSKGVIKAPVGFSGTIFSTAGDGSKFIGLNIDGQRGGAPVDVNAYAIALSHSNMEVRDCTIQHCVGAGIGAYKAKNITISNNVVTDCGANNIVALQDCVNLSIVGNKCSKTSTQNNIFVCGQLAFGSSNVMIKNNTCQDAFDFGLEVGNVFTGMHTNVTVTNNIIVNAGNAGISFRRAIGVIIDNNIKNSGSAIYGGDGIFCTGDGAIVAGQLEITNNMVNVRSPAIGIHVTNYDGAIIKQNQISGGTTGIYVEAETGRIWKNVSITSNTITGASVMGIRAIGGKGSTDLSILRNTVDLTGNGTKAYSISSSIARATLSDNVARGCKGSAYELFALSSVILTNNQAIDCASSGTGTDDDQSAFHISSVSGLQGRGNSYNFTGAGSPAKYAFSVHNSSSVQMSGNSSAGQKMESVRSYSNMSSTVGTDAQ